MTEIPEDIRKAAQAVYAGYVLDVKQRYAPGVSDIEELVTRHAAAALMAERVSESERTAALLKDPAAVRINYLRGDIACQALIDEATAAERERCLSKVCRPDPSDWSIPTLDEPDELLEYIRDQIREDKP